jgi:hypothetical protein
VRPLHEPLGVQAPAGQGRRPRITFGRTACLHNVRRGCERTLLRPGAEGTPE